MRCWSYVDDDPPVQAAELESTCKALGMQLQRAEQQLQEVVVSTASLRLWYSAYITSHLHAGKAGAITYIRFIADIPAYLTLLDTAVRFVHHLCRTIQK